MRGIRTLPAFGRVVACLGAFGGALLLPAASFAIAIDNSAFTPEQKLGEQLFFDTSLSQPGGQSCGSCHAPGFAFTDPNKSSPTSAGVNPTLFGNRNAPSAMYAAYSPAFHYDTDAGSFTGGQFLDGRANSLEDQAKAPFLNPLEMANPSKASVVAKVEAGTSAALFQVVYGPNAFGNTDQAYDNIAKAIASFERTPALSPFSSKYDAYLAGKVSLTPTEMAGLQLFEDPNKGNCSACHTSRPSADGTPPLFTDFTYDNLGVPKNPHNKFYTLPGAYNPLGSNVIDLGLSKTTGDPGDDGRFKVETLRNIAVTGPYFHNGYFDNLRDLVDFYNTRDVKPVCADPLTSEQDADAQGCWPAPEVADTVNHDELGNLGLTNTEVDDIVAFLDTLTDGFVVTEPTSASLLCVGLLTLGLRRRAAR